MHDEDLVRNVFQSKLKLQSQNKEHGGKKKMKKFLKIRRILEISLRTMNTNIFHVTHARKQVTWRKTVGIMES